MSEPSVWAPNAAEVLIDSGGTQSAMRRTHGGWWRAESPVAPHRDYSFVVDGTSAPDPRSRHQPEGVHGPSRTVDHSAFQWTDSEWRGIELDPSVVLYEMHVGTFTETGTCEAAIARLDHLVDLGVKAVEIMPVAEFSGNRGWGYDGVDLFAPHHAYGGPEGLKRLVDELHARGLAAVLDVVYNHLGPEGNYLSVFGPYFTDRYATPWGQAVNLDTSGSDDVRAFICDNAVSWLRDYHFDGLRLDAVHEFVDRSAVHLLEQLATAVHAFGEDTGRRTLVIAESDLNDPRLMRPRGELGFGIDAQWCDDFHHSLHAVLTGERNGYYADFGPISELAKALRQGYVYDGRFSVYRDRHHGRPPLGLVGRNFVVYAQNHDQVGNRARGERLSALVSSGALKIAAALVLTSPFVPMLFQGEEWAASTPFQYFTDHQDPALAKAVSEGRRREFSAFGWSPEEVPDPQDPATFERSRLNWAEAQTEPHRSVLQWHRDLIRLRAHPELRNGRMDLVATAFDEEARWLLVSRGSVHVACNFGRTGTTLPLGKPAQVLMASEPDVTLSANSLSLPPESVAIFRS